MSKVGKNSREIVETGFRAKALREDATFNEAADDLDAEWTRQWKLEQNPDKRQEYWFLIRALEGVRHQLYTMQSDGEIEASASKRISTR